MRDGDSILIDQENKRLDVEISEAEMETRRKAWSPPALKVIYFTSYLSIYLSKSKSKSKSNFLSIYIYVYIDTYICLYLYLFLNPHLFVPLSIYVRMRPGLNIYI